MEEELSMPAAEDRPDHVLVVDDEVNLRKVLAAIRAQNVVIEKDRWERIMAFVRWALLALSVVAGDVCSVLPGALVQLKAANAEIKIRLRQGRTEELLPLLASGELDLAAGGAPAMKARAIPGRDAALLAPGLEAQAAAFQAQGLVRCSATRQVGRRDAPAQPRLEAGVIGAAHVVHGLGRAAGLRKRWGGSVWRHRLGRERPACQQQSADPRHAAQNA